VKTSRGIRDFATGDRVYFLRNENHKLRVKNGTLGTITELDGRNFVVKLDALNAKGQETVQFNIQDYRDIEHGYAATVHKAQGITVDRAHVLTSKYFDRHTTYVAMSRHREGADLYYSREEFSGFNELARTIGRERSKDVTLDYTQARNFESAETKLLGHNHFEQQQQYAMILTKERMQQAENRLTERHNQLVIKEDVARLEKNFGLKLSFDIKDGERGVYGGFVKIAGSDYGLIKQEAGVTKLIPLEQLESRERHKEIKIEKVINKEGHECLKGFQPEIREREQLKQEREQRLNLERSLDRGGFER
jgi:hypothetical protein